MRRCAGPAGFGHAVLRDLRRCPFLGMSYCRPAAAKGVGYDCVEALSSQDVVFPFFFGVSLEEPLFKAFGNDFGSLLPCSMDAPWAHRGCSKCGFRCSFLSS